MELQLKKVSEDDPDEKLIEVERELILRDNKLR